MGQNKLQSASPTPFYLTQAIQCLQDCPKAFEPVFIKIKDKISKLRDYERTPISEVLLE